MNNVYFTADLHLGHKAIIDHCFRPFSTVEQMDSTLFENVNATVERGDRLYILGDFCLGNLQTVQKYREQINCNQIYLIRGNHDRLSDDQYRAAGFIYKGDLADVKVEGQSIVICHYAMRRWNKSHHGAWHLYGHSHGSLPVDKTLSMDVGVDCHDYSPIGFHTIGHVMKSRTENGALVEANH